MKPYFKSFEDFAENIKIGNIFFQKENHTHSHASVILKKSTTNNCVILTCYVLQSHGYIYYKTSTFQTLIYRNNSNKWSEIYKVL